MSAAIEAGTTKSTLKHNGVDSISFDENGVLPESMPAGQFGGDYIKLSDVKATTVNGGTFTSGAWQTRDLNTEDNDTGGHCSLAANQFTLAAGTYRVLAMCPAFAVSRNQPRLYNISDASVELLGQIGYAVTAGNGSASVFVVGEFTITAAKIFELQHRCETTTVTLGFGTATSFGLSEIYSTIELWKVK